MRREQGVGHAQGSVHELIDTQGGTHRGDVEVRSLSPPARHRVVEELSQRHGRHDTSTPNLLTAKLRRRTISVMAGPIVRARDVAFPRFRAPDLDEMECFLHSFGMRHRVSHQWRAVHAREPTRITTCT